MREWMGWPLYQTAAEMLFLLATLAALAALTWAVSRVPWNRPVLADWRALRALDARSKRFQRRQRRLERRARGYERRARRARRREHARNVRLGLFPAPAW